MIMNEITQSIYSTFAAMESEAAVTMSDEVISVISGFRQEIIFFKT